MAKRRVVKEEIEPTKMKPLAIAQWGTAAVFAILITHNAFFGQNQLEQKLAKLPDGVTNKIVVEAPVSAPKNVNIRYDRRIAAVQRELLATGHYVGEVDGIAGQRTKLAVEAYQRSNQMEANGIVTDKLLEHIRFTRKVVQASNNTGSVSKAVVPVTPKKERDLKIMRMQKLLAQLGYDPGEATGFMTKSTQTAILRFEIDAGMPPKGDYSEAVFGAMVKMQSAAATAD